MTVDTENVSTPAEGGQAVPVDNSSLDLDAALAKAFESQEPEAVVEPEVESEPEPEPEPEPETKPEDEPAEASADEPVEDTEKPAEELTAPEDWSEEQRAVFAKLPNEGREVLLRQYKDFQAGFTKKTQALAERRKLADEVENVLTSVYGDQMRAQNVNPVEAIRRLVAAERFASQNPVAFLQQFVHNAGIDLSKLTQAAGDKAENASVDTAAIDRMVQARLAPMQQAIEAQQLAEGMKRVEAFATAKDPSGQLLHPHFDDDLAVRMNTLIRSGVATDLDHAYKIAVRENDAIYQAEIEGKRKQALEKEQQKQAEAVAKARKAVGTVAPKKSTPPATVKKVQSLEDALSNALAQHYK